MEFARLYVLSAQRLADCVFLRKFGAGRGARRPPCDPNWCRRWRIFELIAIGVGHCFDSAIYLSTEQCVTFLEVPRSTMTVAEAPRPISI